MNVVNMGYLMQPLGFSDLTDDEALVVGLFRDWRVQGADQSHVGKDPWSVDQDEEGWTLLLSLFFAFDQNSGAGLAPIGTGDLLSPTEELLLNYISREIPPNLSLFTGSSKPEFKIRLTKEIARSGKDELLLRIQSGYMNVIRGF